MSGEGVEGVVMLFGGFGAGVWRVWVGCMEGLWRLSSECWRLSGGCGDVFGGCRDAVKRCEEAVWRVKGCSLEGCGKAVWRGSGDCLLGVEMLSGGC